MPESDLLQQQRQIIHDLLRATANRVLAARRRMSTRRLHSGRACADEWPPQKLLR